MSRADRIVHRREWIAACPPVFDQPQKLATAKRLGRIVDALRTTWREWLKGKS